LEQIFTACMLLLMATSTFGLEKRSWSSPQWCYLHHLYPMAFLMHTIENEKRTMMAAVVLVMISRLQPVWVDSVLLRFVKHFSFCHIHEVSSFGDSFFIECDI